MKRSTVLVVLVAVALVAPGLAGAHNLLDHDAPGFTEATPPNPAFMSGGTGAQWELLTSFPTGNPHTDLDFFTQGGETFVAVGTLGVGPNAGGQTILQLTQDGEPVDDGGASNATYVSAHPSASCISDPSAALGLQHDVEAAPKGTALLNTANAHADTSDTQLIIDATDAGGRCHDQGTLGFEGVPQGGLEFIDVTDIANPVEIGFTSHIGESHTVNVDPKRPHIAYSVTSDGVDNDNNGTPGDPTDDVRANESSGLGLDGFEVVDFSSCMDFPEGTTVADKRAQCRPEVYRYRYPEVAMTLGHTNQGTLYGCHELEVYPNDMLTCASGQALLVLDMSGAFDDNGTPDDYSDDTPRGEPLPCRERASTSGPGFTTGATIMDCVDSNGDGTNDLSVSGWLDAGAPSLEGVEHVGTAYHMGRESTGETSPAYAADQDIDFNHEAELTHSGNFAFASDERGGGVAPPGASCAPEVDNTAGNGGLHAYAMDRLDTEFPAQFDEDGAYDAAATAEEAFDAYARTPAGDKAIIRVPVRTRPQGALCTAHVFQQIPDQQRLFMGWYSQGTHVIDYIENPDGTFEWEEVGYFIPVDANQWVSHIFDYERNDDGTWTYYGAAGDFELGDAGRSTVDIYRVTLPPPAQPLVTQSVEGVTGPTQACQAPFVPDAGFTDTGRSVFQDNIDCIGWYGITRGLDADTYGPRQTVSRAQMASFIARLLVEGGVTLPATPPDAFEDDGDSVHHDAINALAALGIVQGRQDADDVDGDGDTDEILYFPHEQVRRDQMASFVARAHEAVVGDLPQDPPDSFDDDGDNVHHGAINALAALGVVDGRVDTDDADGDGDTNEHLYFPHEDVSRGQMAGFLVRELRLQVDDGQAVPGGARVELAQQQAFAGQSVDGTVTSNKAVRELTADGCGLDDEALEPDGDGAFTVTIPAEQPAGSCELTISAVTARDADGPTQAVDYAFAFEVQ